MFHPDRDLKQTIISMLSEEGRSISYLSKELKKRGFDMHRLILTGYLRALSDLNILKEKDIYIRIAEHARSISPERPGELTLYALYRLFRRPIFKEELERAGVLGLSPGVQAKEEDIADTRKFMLKAGFKVPTSSKAYVPLNDELEGAFQGLLMQMVVTESESAYLVKETKQSKLDL